MRNACKPPVRFHGVLAPNAKMRAQGAIGPAERAEASQPAACEPDCAHRRPVRMSWTRLLKRVPELDLEHCPNCGGDLKIIAAILEAPVIEPRALRSGVLAPGAEGAGCVWHFLELATSRPARPG